MSAIGVWLVGRREVVCGGVGTEMMWSLSSRMMYWFRRRGSCSGLSSFLDSAGAAVSVGAAVGVVGDWVGVGVAVGGWVGAVRRAGGLITAACLGAMTAHAIARRGLDRWTRPISR